MSVGNRQATATLYDNPAARDFAALLPVSVSMHDLFGREKAGPLPRPLAAGRGQSTYRSGQLGYWAPSRDLAIYFHDDGERIPSPGIVMIGEVDDRLDVITSAGDAFQLRITRID